MANSLVEIPIMGTRPLAVESRIIVQI